MAPKRTTVEAVDGAVEFHLRDRFVKTGVSQNKIHAYKGSAESGDFKVRIARWNDGGSIWASMLGSNHKLVYIADQRLRVGLPPVVEDPKNLFDAALVVPEYDQPRLFGTGSVETFTKNVEVAIAEIFGATQDKLFPSYHGLRFSTVRPIVA
ncbi:hypothetical protein M409DRAFT_29035 [Zasmidium cellare ATCC 36951]|uniref:Uncharacterized protein n=1 Tax=Zasmidium cellare ATCC 36951 TaxID=1080233 RepID=A0A6A6C0W4_ZASCE|nr:uncharacterized protein M409DRAFT_29035 [Zasmidium cellare ATCC 36951]KAF2160651.1 hypothetical protein M409DRAFT_29035 [Zasmidium cellare ATCC 36951]